MLNKIILIIIGFFIASNANESLLDPVKVKFETMYFDVVQKQLVIEKDLPVNVDMLVTKWFNENIKINGLDGNMKFTIYDYNQETSSIPDGKRVDISMSFRVLLKKPLLSQKKSIEGKVSSYGTLSGDFTLSEFDTIILNTQTDLILRLSQDLKNKS